MLLIYDSLETLFAFNLYILNGTVGLMHVTGLSEGFDDVQKTICVIKIMSSILNGSGN